MLTCQRQSRSTSTAGFTLIEVLVVVIMVAVLMSIAAPGWLAFANRQRANTVRDAALQTLRTAQSRAQQNRETQTVSVINDGGIPALEIGVGPVLADGSGPSGFVVPLGNNEIPENTIQVSGFALNDAEWVARDTVSFNYQGAVENGQVFKIDVQPINGGETRCVVITTLLGSIQTFNGDACNLTTFD